MSGGETEGSSGVEEQAARLESISAGLRRAIGAALDLDGAHPELPRLRDEVHALAARIEAAATGRTIDLFGAAQGDDLNPILRFSPVMGRLNPVAPPLEVRRDGERVKGQVTLGPAYQGAHGLVHGAVIAALYDDLLAIANVAAGCAGPTATLSIHYRAPTPLGEPLRLEAWQERVEGRRIHTMGRCFHGNTLLTEAEGLFIHFGSQVQGKGWAGQGG